MRTVYGNSVLSVQVLKAVFQKTSPFFKITETKTYKKKKEKEVLKPTHQADDLRGVFCPRPAVCSGFRPSAQHTASLPCGTHHHTCCVEIENTPPSIPYEKGIS